MSGEGALPQRGWTDDRKTLFERMRDAAIADDGPESWARQYEQVPVPDPRARFHVKGWACCEEPEEDGDGFIRPHWFALDRKGRRRELHVSRWFDMTPERFEYLVTMDFPRSGRIGPWSHDEVDAAIARKQMGELA